MRTIGYHRWIAAMLAHLADHPSHPFTAFTPLFTTHVPGRGITVEELSAAPHRLAGVHVIPSGRGEEGGSVLPLRPEIFRDGNQEQVPVPVHRCHRHTDRVGRTVVGVVLRLFTIQGVAAA
ncbi:hypothetical protein ACWD0A_10240 [Streptomyces sp. NPDC002867]